MAGTGVLAGTGLQQGWWYGRFRNGTAGAPGWQEGGEDQACGIAFPVTHLESAVSLFTSH